MQGAHLAVAGGRSLDPSAEGGTQRLMAQTDTEDRHGTGEHGDRVDARAGLARSPGSGGDHQRGGSTARDRGGVDRVAADHVHGMAAS